MVSALEQDLQTILGPGGWLPREDARPYARDWLDRYGVPPIGVARPATTEEVAAVMAACHRARVPVIPRGGNTGLCGASVCEDEAGLIVSLGRMARLGLPDPATGAIEVEAGVVLASLHAVLEPHGLIFPLHLGAEGSAQIGGLIGANAGGSHALRYGMMQDLVLGLEVVLPDGAIWNGMRAVQKDNAGYQLRRLFCGAEGTLGVVTRAMLRLFPAPRQRATALLALPDADALVALGSRLRAESGEFLSGLEFFGDLGLDLVLRHVSGVDFPLESRSAFYLLVEMTASSARVPLDDILEAALADGMEDGLVTDGVLATSESQRAAIWRIREEMPEGQRLEGPQLKHDISVPPGRLAAFLAEGAALCQALLPGLRISAFGHLGDGNVHYNLSLPAGRSDFGDYPPGIARSLGALASRMQGSFAAEHGLGRSKIALADELRDPVERQLMARVKASIDPENLMNPGVILNGASLPSTWS